MRRLGRHRSLREQKRKGLTWRTTAGRVVRSSFLCRRMQTPGWLRVLLVELRNLLRGVEWQHT